MFGSAYYDNEVETVLMRMKCFESELKSKRKMVCKKFMTDKNIDLSSGMSFLIKANETNDTWHILDSELKIIWMNDNE